MNKEKFDYLGITKFHQAGYFGQGITFASRESLSPHGKKVFNVMQQICPEANLQYRIDYRKVPKDVDIYTTSMFSPMDKIQRYIDKGYELYESGTFLCCAVGNDTDESQTFLSMLPFWTAIGACYYTQGKLRRAEYSSITNDIDYMSITNMDTEFGVFSGTSCATPVFAGMCALVQCFFKQSVGRKLTNSELLNFIMDYTEDIGDEGFDNKTGNGIFRLPNPEEINVKKYINANKIIKLKLYEDIAYIDDKALYTDAEPILYKNRTMVPIRFIAEALDCEVLWDQERQEVTIIS